MSAACESYKADNVIYACSAGSTGTDGLDPTTANIAAYDTPSRYMYGEISGDRDFDGTPDTGARLYMTFKPISLSRANMSSPPSSSNPITAIRDPFGNSYGYSTAKQANPSYGFNPTFDLWSTAGTKNASDAAYETKWIKNW